MLLFEKNRPQFLLDRLERYIKLLVSTVVPFSYAVASQFGLAIFVIGENPKKNESQLIVDR